MYFIAAFIYSISSTRKAQLYLIPFKGGNMGMVSPVIVSFGTIVSFSTTPSGNFLTMFGKFTDQFISASWCGPGRRNDFPDVDVLAPQEYYYVYPTDVFVDLVTESRGKAAWGLYPSIWTLRFGGK